MSEDLANKIRKQPGRKRLKDDEDLTNDQLSKRRTQNRAAQRSFRERKKNLIQSLQDRILEMGIAKNAREKELLEEIDRLRQENEMLKRNSEPLKWAQTNTSPSQYSRLERIEDNNVLQCAPENEKPCKMKVLNILSHSRCTYRSLIQVHTDIMSYCPDFRTEQLPDQLQRRIQDEPNSIASEKDIEFYIQCIEKARL